MADEPSDLEVLRAAIEDVAAGRGLPRARVDAAPDRLRPHLERLRALDEERLFLEQIVEHIPDMIFVKEAGELRFVRFNRAGEELLGYRRDDLLGRSDRDFFPPDEASSFTAKDREVLAGGTLVDIAEEPIHTRAKGPRWLHTKKIPILDREGRPVYLLGISEDITDAKTAREDLARAERELAAERLQARLLEAQRLESLGLMAGGIAHDFNNLLVAILGNASLALADLPSGHSARSAVEMVERAARAAAELTRQLLAYSGKGRFVVEPIDVSALVRDMSALLEVTLSRRGTLSLDLLDGAPPVEADVAQLRQLVLNLMTNAADALAGRGTGSITIRTSLTDLDAEALRDLDFAPEASPGRHVQLEVSDDGCGMDEETRQRMFDPFFTTKEQGHGLGLAAAIGIVRGHRGGLRVTSQPGAGTTVTVLLPVSTGTAGAPAGLAAPSAELAGRTVLVVDDEELVRELASRVLRRVGMRVLVAASGEEALSRFGADVDVVLLDLTMPGLRGDEVHAELRRRRPEVRVVLSSGYNEVDATRQSAGDARVGFLQKPYTPDELVAKIRDQLGGVGAS